MTPSNPKPGEGQADLKHLLGILLNKHYAMAADEHNETASDTSIRRHYSESLFAENELIAAIDSLQAAHARLLASNAEMREALVNATQYILENGNVRDMAALIEQLDAALARHPEKESTP